MTASVWLCPSAYSPHVGGIEEVTRQHAAELRRRGREVRVVTHRHPAGLAEEETVDGVPVHRVRFPTPTASVNGAAGGAVDAVRSLRSLRRLRRPDLVHVHGASAQLSTLLAYCTLHRVPLVVTTHGEVAADDDGAFRSGAFLRASLRMAAHRAAALTAVSAVSRAAAAAVAGEFASAHLVPNGVDPSQWQVGPTPEQPVFGAWGRHEDVKGWDVLLTAFALVRATRPDAVLLLGGTGDRSATLRAQAGAGVEFLGRLDPSGVAGLLRRCRTVVVPSRYEAFGLVALEAMAAGRTVVWSELPGLRVATGGLGHAVEVNDPDALAAAMLAADREPASADALRTHAATFSWGDVVDQYEEIYARCRLRRR